MLFLCSSKQIEPNALSLGDILSPHLNTPFFTHATKILYTYGHMSFAYNI